MPSPSQNITNILMAVSSGDQSAWEKLVPLVYHQLKNLSRAALRKEEPDHTLQTTALVNELFLRLLRRQEAQWENRTHFYRAAAMALNWILLDYAKHKRTGGRPGKAAFVPLDSSGELRDNREYSKKLEILDLALRRFEAQDSVKRKTRIINLHFLLGLSFEEISRELDVSISTVKNDWRFAKAWLVREIRKLENHGI